MLALLIPKSMITSLIHERMALSDQAINEVSSKWANGQVVSGPVLTIPLVYQNTDKTDDDKLITETHYLRILPTELDIKGDIFPRERSRGIYKIILYESDLNISGSLKLPEFQKENLIEVKWDKAYLSMSISDLRGIVDEIEFKLDQDILEVESGSRISSYNSGITMKCPNASKLESDELDFSVKLKVQGSDKLHFTPDGDITTININSSWPDPSFDGYVLPDSHETNESGFSASWKLLQLNRNYPTSWMGISYFTKQAESSFGVSLFKGNGHYQKSLRSAKYGAMIIALNFLVFFLVELINENRIHPFQYILVGLALILFFSLLVALSEHISYNQSFVVSASATILLVSLYTKSILNSWKMAGLMATTLITIYTFLFFTLQSTDYALLIGSVGLTAILGATMYFTRNIKWYSGD